MAFRKPKGNTGIKGRSTKQAEENKKRMEALEGMVPIEVCAGLVANGLERADAEMADKPIFKDCNNPEEFEKQFLEKCAGKETECKKSIVEFVKGLIGKTYGDAKPTPKELAEEIEEKAEFLRIQVVRSWLNILFFSYDKHMERNHEVTRMALDDILLPITVYPEEVFGENYPGVEKDKRWIDVLENSLILSVNFIETERDGIKLLFKEFIKNVFAEIGRTGRIELFDGFFICVKKCDLFDGPSLICKDFFIYLLDSE